jgi:hypothetical protein
MIRLVLVLSLVLSAAYGAAVRCSVCPAVAADFQHCDCHSECENQEQASHAHERPLTPTAVNALPNRAPVGAAITDEVPVAAFCSFARLPVAPQTDSRANPWQRTARSTILQI